MARRESRLSLVSARPFQLTLRATVGKRFISSLFRDGTEVRANLAS